MADPASLQDVREILASARTIAVIGAHPTTWRPAFYVPDYLYGKGYRILPCHPRFADKGTELWGESVRASVADLGEPVDIVDVFRASGNVPEHLDEILAMDPRPKVVWLQLGIENHEVATALRAEGITVVQDRCTLADHRALGLGPVA